MSCNCGKSSFNTFSTQSMGGTPVNNTLVAGVPVAPPAPVQTQPAQAPLSGIQAPQASGNAFVR